MRKVGWQQHLSQLLKYRYTPQTLAQCMKVDVSTISRWKNNKTEPVLSHKLRLEFLAKGSY